MVIKHEIVSVLHQNEGVIGKSIPDILGRGKSPGLRGWNFPYLLSFGGL